MQLNHLNLSFVDVPAASAFFQRHFGFRVIGADNKAISVLEDSSGFVLVVSNFEKALSVTYPGAFHVGFIQETVAEVEAIYARMKADGVSLGEPPKKTHRGTTFYGMIENTVMFEVLSRE